MAKQKHDIGYQKRLKNKAEKERQEQAKPHNHQQSRSKN